MPTELPEGLQKALEIVGGQRWPEGDEDGLDRMSEAWSTMQRSLEMLDRALQRSRDAVSANMSGAYADAHTKWIDNDMRPTLDKVQEEAENYANLCKNTSADIQYAKAMIIAQLAMIAATLAFEWLPGIGQAITAAAAGTARVVIAQIMKQVVFNIATHAAGGAALMTSLDASIQGMQMLTGERTEWNADLTKGAALGGALGGAMGGALSGAARGVASNAAGKNFGEQAQKFTQKAAGKATHDLAVAGGQGVGELGGDLASNAALGGKAAAQEGSFTSGMLGGFGSRGSSKGGQDGQQNGQAATEAANDAANVTTPAGDAAGKGLGLDGSGIATQSEGEQSGDSQSGGQQSGQSSSGGVQTTSTSDGAQSGDGAGNQDSSGANSSDGQNSTKAGENTGQQHDNSATAQHSGDSRGATEHNGTGSQHDTSDNNAGGTDGRTDHADVDGNGQHTEPGRSTDHGPTDHQSNSAQSSNQESSNHDGTTDSPTRSEQSTPDEHPGATSRPEDTDQTGSEQHDGPDVQQKSANPDFHDGSGTTPDSRADSPGSNPNTGTDRGGDDALGGPLHNDADTRTPGQEPSTQHTADDTANSAHSSSNASAEPNTALRGDIGDQPAADHTTPESAQSASDAQATRENPANSPSAEQPGAATPLSHNGSETPTPAPAAFGSHPQNGTTPAQQPAPTNAGNTSPNAPGPAQSTPGSAPSQQSTPPPVADPTNRPSTTSDPSTTSNPNANPGAKPGATPGHPSTSSDGPAPRSNGESRPTATPTPEASAARPDTATAGDNKTSRNPTDGESSAPPPNRPEASRNGDNTGESRNARIDSYRPDPARGEEEKGRWAFFDDGRSPEFQSLPPSEHVLLRGDNGETFGVTPVMVDKWAADNGVSIPSKGGIRDAISNRLYPKDPSRKPEVYDPDEAQRFRDDLKADSARKHADEQHREMEAANKTADWIAEKYPPDQFNYVGLGRSPAPVVAALTSHGHDTRSVPLSDFRPAPHEPNSILNRPFEEILKQPHHPTPEQHRMLDQHFEEFLGDLPGNKDVLLIDYTQRGLSLVAAQYYLQHHLNGSPNAGSEVHALAMHQDIDTSNINQTHALTVSPGTQLGKLREMLWDRETANQRQQWENHFQKFSLGEDGPLQKDGPLFGQAFKEEAFDKLSEHGSYKILNQDPATFDANRPRRDHEPTPEDEPRAYDVLTNAVRAARDPHAWDDPDVFFDARSHFSDDTYFSAPSTPASPDSPAGSRSDGESSAPSRDAGRPDVDGESSAPRSGRDMIASGADHLGHLNAHHAVSDTRVHTDGIRTTQLDKLSGYHGVKPEHYESVTLDGIHRPESATAGNHDTNWKAWYLAEHPDHAAGYGTNDDGATGAVLRYNLRADTTIHDIPHGKEADVDWIKRHLGVPRHEPLMDHLGERGAVLRTLENEDGDHELIVPWNLAEHGRAKHFSWLNKYGELHLDPDDRPNPNPPRGWGRDYTGTPVEQHRPWQHRRGTTGTRRPDGASTWDHGRERSYRSDRLYASDRPHLTERRHRSQDPYRSDRRHPDDVFHNGLPARSRYLSPDPRTTHHYARPRSAETRYLDYHRRSPDPRGYALHARPLEIRPARNPWHSNPYNHYGEPRVAPHRDTTSDHVPNGPERPRAEDTTVHAGRAGRPFTSPDQWGAQRDNAPVSHHRTDRFDPTKATTVDRGGNVDFAGNRTRIDHDLRRFQDHNGNWVREYTVKPDLAPHDSTLTPDELNQFGQRVKAAVEGNFNGRYRLPDSGDQLHIRVEPNIVPRDDSRITSWFDDPDQHPYIKVHNSGQSSRPTQLTWDTHHPDGPLAHEIMHLLGLGEGYTDPNLVLRHPEQDGVMGRGAWDAHPGLNETNLADLERISNSGPVIRDHPLQDPAAAKHAGTGDHDATTATETVHNGPDSFGNPDVDGESSAPSKSHEVGFEQGSKELSEHQRRDLDSFADDVIHEARNARRAGRPLPDITITGYGNGSHVPGIGSGRAEETGAQRAQAVRDAINERLASGLDRRPLPESDLRSGDFRITHRTAPSGTDGSHTTPESRRNARIELNHEAPRAAVGAPGTTEVPKNLHMAWFGNSKHLDGELADLFHQWQDKAGESDWQMHVWVDDRAEEANPGFLDGMGESGAHVHNVQNPRTGNTGMTPDVAERLHYALDHDAFNLASDITRYAALHEHGGAYLDSDIAPGQFSLPREPTRMSNDGIPFVAPAIRDADHASRIADSLQKADPEHWHGRTPTENDIVDWQYRTGEFNNNLIVSPQHSPFLNDVLDSLPTVGAMKAREGNLRQDAAHLTGPHRITEQINQNLRQHGLRNPVAVEFRAGRATTDPGMVRQWSHQLQWVTDQSSDQLHDAPRQNTTAQKGESSAPPPHDGTAHDGTAATNRRGNETAVDHPQDDTAHQPLRGEADSRPLPRIAVTDEEGRPALTTWQSLPAWVRGSRSLGSIASHHVDASGLDDLVRTMLPEGPRGTRPVGVERIESSANREFESFLDRGRSFPIRSGKQWYQARVRAVFPDSPESTPDTTGTQDPTQNIAMIESGTDSARTSTIDTTRTLGSSIEGGPLVGPYGRVGLRAPLARPSVSRSDQLSSSQQHDFRTTGGSSKAEAPVRFEVQLTDSNGAAVPQRPETPTAIAGRVSLQIPHDLGTFHDPGQVRAGSPEAGWAARLDHPATEAVVLGHDRFDDVASRLHPSITRLGAPGREALEHFLSSANVRTNFGQLLQGWVLSPELVSAHGNRGSAVQMTASASEPKLVGVTDAGFTRAHDSASSSSALSSATKSGFEGNVAAGGSAISGSPLGGSAMLTAGHSAHSTATNKVGGQHTSKVAMQVKGDVGLYEAKIDLTVATRNGEPIHVPATAHMRIGLPEAAEQGLPVPHGTRASIATPTAEKRFPPPYLAAKAAMGNVKISDHGPANRALPHVQDALSALGEIGDFLPKWGDAHTTPERTGKHVSDEREKFDNQRKLTAALSPGALRAKWDALLGQGTDVQLKKRGMFTNDYVNVRVRARLGDGEHLGEAGDRSVRASAATSPTTGSSSTLAKGWSAGVEGRMLHLGVVDHHRLAVTPTASLKYTSTTARTQSANPSETHTPVAVGSPNSQVFRHNTELDVEITSYSRPRAWVKRLTPGSPMRTVPEPQVLARTVRDGETAPDGARALAPISGETTLWVPNGTTEKHDQGQFRPGEPTSRELGEQDPRSIQELLNRGNRPGRTDGMHVEAVTGTEFVRDAALGHFDRAADGDGVLGLPGSTSRRAIDDFFSPEHIAANLGRLSDHGQHVDGLHYDRRVYDRLGSVGMSYGLKNPKLVSIADDISTENSTTGGHAVSETTGKSRGWDFDLSLNHIVRPGTDPADSASYVASAAVAAKPWSRSRTRSAGDELSGTVERTRSTPEQARTALVRMDADVTLIAESQQRNLLHSTTPQRSGSVITLPGGVFVRVDEEQARAMGVLPDRRSPEPQVPESERLAPPRLFGQQQPSSIGMSMVDTTPDLRGLLGDMRAELGDRGAELLPDWVLDDAMRNQHKLVNLTSPGHVQALQDSALDGGITTLAHTPGFFGRTTYWSQLRAQLDGEPEFLDVVHDGVEMDHTVRGSTKHTEADGKTSGWSVGLRGPSGASPGTGNPDISSTAGTGAGAEVSAGQQHSTGSSSARTSKASRLSTASGPAARYRVPIRFELVTGRGDEPGTVVSSESRPMRMRVHANNVPTAGHEPAPVHGYSAQAHERVPADARPEAIRSWQQEHGTALPHTAVAEALRGSTDLREGAGTALTNAGASKRITGPGTPAAHALHSALSPEMLQAQLVGGRTDPLRVPHLHAISLLTGEHADVEVHRRLSHPRLVGLSDHVTMADERAETSTRSGESSHTGTGSATVAPGAGRTVLPDPDPGGGMISSTGAEHARARGDVDGSSGGSTGTKTNNVKVAGRSGLVEYDAEYRIVATSGGNVGVVDVHVPASTHVRMDESGLRSELHRDLPDSLRSGQDRLKRAADEWREAEVASGRARHASDDRINENAPHRDAAHRALETRQAETAAARDRLARAEQRVEQARSRSADEQARLPEFQARARAHVDELSLKADSALARVWSAGASRAEAENAMRDLQQQGRTDEVEAARRSYSDALAEERQAAADHARWDAEFRSAAAEAERAPAAAEEATAEFRAAEQEQHRSQESLERAREREESAHRAAREAADEVATSERELDAAREQVRIAKKAWLSAKTAVDDEIRAFNGAEQPISGAERANSGAERATSDSERPAPPRLDPIPEKPDARPQDPIQSTSDSTERPNPEPGAEQQNGLASFLHPERNP